MNRTRDLHLFFINPFLISLYKYIFVCGENWTTGQMAARRGAMFSVRAVDGKAMAQLMTNKWSVLPFAGQECSMHVYISFSPLCICVYLCICFACLASAGGRGREAPIRGALADTLPRHV